MREIGWDIPGAGITDILINPLDPYSDSKNILQHYGELELETIQAFDHTYLVMESRVTEGNYAMYYGIINSVEKKNSQKN